MVMLPLNHVLLREKSGRFSYFWESAEYEWRKPLSKATEVNFQESRRINKVYAVVARAVS